MHSRDRSCCLSYLLVLLLGNVLQNKTGVRYQTSKKVLTLRPETRKNSRSQKTHVEFTGNQRATRIIRKWNGRGES